MQIRHLLLVVACGFSCSRTTDSTDSQTADSSHLAKSVQESLTKCFSYRAGEDSAFLRVTIESGIVTGELSYDFFEKDRNRGKIAGKLRGDTLFANYTFISEGAESVREVAFLKKGAGWAEGFGEVRDSAGTMLFKEHAKLDFKNGLYFEPTECSPPKQ